MTHPHAFISPMRIGASILVISLATFACERRTEPAHPAGPAMGSTAAPETVAPLRKPSAADVAALNRILRHHEQTVVLAEGAVDRAVHPELRDFIAGVLRDRRQEIDQLRRLGATSAVATAAAPKPAEEPTETIDVQFVTSLAAHEEAGRTMARELLATTTNPDVRSFAEGVINKAGSELTQLNAWRQQWSEIGHQDQDREQ